MDGLFRLWIATIERVIARGGSVTWVLCVLVSTKAEANVSHIINSSRNSIPPIFTKYKMPINDNESLVYELTIIRRIFHKWAGKSGISIGLKLIKPQ